MQKLYILRVHEPVEVASLEEWYAWFAAFGGQRIVARTELGPAVVLTAFQGLDDPPTGIHWSGGPNTFETVVLGGPLNGFQRRYGRWDEAALGHRDCVARVAWAGHPPESSGAVEGDAHLASAGSAHGFCEPVTHRTKASLYK